MPQLPGRGEAAILDRDDDGLSGIERGADLARVRVGQKPSRPRLLRAALISLVPTQFGGNPSCREI
jgi:hypothetical protein